MKRLDIQFCPFCGSKKVSPEQARIRCSSCGRLFSVEELPLLRESLAELRGPYLGFLPQE